MTEATLDATFPLAIQIAHALGQRSVSDRRAREWIYRRLPAELVRSKPLTVFPAPWVDIEELLADLQARLPQYLRMDMQVRLAEAEACRERVEASCRAIVVGHARGEGVRYWEEFHIPDGLGSVFDWLNGLDEEDPRLLDKILRVTWEQAVEKARVWHQRLAKIRSNGIAGDDGTANWIDVGDPALLGWSWCQLVTKGALDREGMALGHCVGSKAYEHHAWPAGVQGPSCGIWSLRDESGRSHVPVEICDTGISQAFGPGNSRPASETAAAFGDLVLWFAPPGTKFHLPNWLFRDEGGATRLREASDASNHDSWARMHVPYGGVLFRPMGAGNFIGLGDVDEVRVTQRVRYSSRSPGAPRIEVVTTQLDAQVEMLLMNDEALRGLLDLLGTPPQYDPVAERGRHERQEPRPATPLATEPRRGGQHRYEGEPAYRRLERRFAGRPS